MRIWKFEYCDPDLPALRYTHYRKNEGDAKVLKELLDTDGYDYKMRSYDSLEQLIKTSSIYINNNYSDREKLNFVLDSIGKLGL